jgi:hypothetical protein
MPEWCIKQGEGQPGKGRGRGILKKRGEIAKSIPL